ncbi:hypothetical protein H4Q26_012651 [Puccinia striiformis f. sp. tritici PST-130]|nr:hypothetical protein H4Q26_012651 [Puccinia striiformis f. sp. tritici PST-130]
MAETSQQSNKPSDSNSNSNSLLAQQPRNDFAELESSLPPLPDIGRSLPSQGPPDLDQGVSPSNVNPLAASLALASNMPTPVPAPIERFRHEPAPSGRLGMEPFPLRPEDSSLPPASSNPVQSPTREHGGTDGRSSLYETIRPRQAMLDHQWALFVVAQEARDFNLMRMALNQAIPSQDLLTNLVRPRRDAENQQGLGGERRISPSRPFNVEQLGQPHSGPGAESSRTTSHPDRLSPTANPNTAPPHQPVRRANHTNRNQRETPSDPRDSIPGTYPLRDAREVTTASSTAYFTPGVPGSIVALRPVMAPQIYATHHLNTIMATRTTSSSTINPTLITLSKTITRILTLLTAIKEEGTGVPDGGKKTHHANGPNGGVIHRVERILARTSRIRGRERRQRNQSNPQYQIRVIPNKLPFGPS